MLSVTARRAALVAVVAVLSASCTVHDKNTPALTGPSGLALQLRVVAVPSSIAFGVNAVTTGEQTAVTVTAIGPDGRGIAQLPIRLNILVDGAPQDYGTLRERNVVTGADGTASTTYTAPPSPANGVISNNCGGSTLGTCIQVVATPTSNNFGTVSPESVSIRLVPTGVIVPPTAAPSVNFTFAPEAPQANAPVQFDASTTCGAALVGGACPPTAPSISSFAWNFGDGATGSGRNVTHAFALQQTYTISLTATNSLGASSTATKVLTVGGGSLPTPTLTVSPSAPAVGDQVFFNGSGSTPGQGHTIASYRWTFGDGASASGANVSHAYLAAGTYSVQLTVVDDAGQSATSGPQTVTVGGPPTPTANFTFSPTQPAIGDTVIFDWRTTTTAQGQRIVSLDWNFGDGTPITHCPGDPACTADGITTHVFRAVGTFNVNLVVTDSAGRTSVKSTQVQVGSGNPVASFTVLPIAPKVGEPVTVDASGTLVFGSATIQSYSWNFNDGTAPDTNGPTTTHTFPGGAQTSKTIVLTVVDSFGRRAQASVTITINNP